MEGSKYYSSSKYLSSVFQKQDRMNRPIQVEQVQTPFHFRQKQMTQQQRSKLLQKKIYDNPHLYVNTHIKCQICNKFIQIQMVDHHSRIHFDEDSRLDRLMSKRNIQVDNA